MLYSDSVLRSDAILVNLICNGRSLATLLQTKINTEKPLVNSALKHY